MKKLTSVIVLASLAGSCVAQDANEKILDQMFAHYSSIEGCSVELSMDIRSEDPMVAAMIEQMGAGTPAYAIKPNKFAFWPDGGAGMGMPSPHVYSDGESLISGLKDLSVYTSVEAPASFGALVEMGSGGMSPQPWQMIPGSDVLFGLMSEDIQGTFGEMFADVSYEGLAGEDLETYHVVVAKQDDGMGGAIDVEIHINAVGDPWLRAIKPDLSDQGGPADLELLLTFGDWDSIDSEIAEGTLEPGDDWRRVDDLFQAAMGGMGGAPAEPAAAVDAGSTAPEFTLGTLDEGEFSLASHRGKVVVLDFWATWCGPCIKGLPSVTKVTGEFADRGVVFAAVNLRESADTVAPFMADKGWDFNVVMDATGEVADMYGITGIPHSVVIDKNGTIRHVHIGFGGADEYEKSLRAELEALVNE